MGRSVGRSAETRLQERLPLLGALAALALRAPEEIGELAVAVALGIGRVLLHPQRVAQALLREPDDVVVLVLGPGDLAALRRHDCLPRSSAGRAARTLASGSGMRGLPRAVRSSTARP